ncbi:SDR family NAD(P)-dependent oxidoreductase [Gammaproteobacteria bacterium]|jgi:NAD(P)-dependent dehydrogenase (short-subunit alcohol dehydrogenase family)|nr:SDR family NAD(P)-dependent oxidoreductase [Gammaproteobacteria bacterium]
MSLIPSFSANTNAVIVGASGGIGAALTRHLSNDERVASVHALARTEVDTDSSKVVRGYLDITCEQAIAEASMRCSADAEVDLVIVATGILHAGKRVRPEKRMSELDGDVMRESFTVNTIGPALVAKHFLPKMARGRKTVFAALSARVGSIGDNRLGGWMSYRASKAALNMLLKTLAIEQSRTRPESVVVGLHPGTVDTNLSRPFQRNVAEQKLFTPDFAGECLLRVVDNLNGTDSGGIFAWDGKRIEY